MSITSAINAITDQLAGEDVTGGKTVEAAINALAPYMTGGGGGGGSDAFEIVINYVDDEDYGSTTTLITPLADIVAAQAAQKMMYVKWCSYTGAQLDNYAYHLIDLANSAYVRWHEVAGFSDEGGASVTVMTCQLDLSSGNISRTSANVVQTY